MAILAEIRKARKKKLDKLQRTGMLAYPAKLKRTHTIEQVLQDFSKLSKGEKEIIITGRIRAIREHGGSVFLNVEDGTGVLQAYLKRDRVGRGAFQLFLDVFDIGDFVQLRGILFTTKKKEKTLEIADYKILAKSLLPLPEKWKGLQDVEERYRKRYLDLLFNVEVKEKFEKKTEIVKAVRSFLEQEGFLEVETPVLQSIYGGADARPFTTHLNAFDMDMFLRIAPELYLKRLLVGGFEKVYEIGRVFRNEGVDRSHNPDFTMLEFYWAYADYKDMMKLTEQMFSHILKKVFLKQKITYEGKEINFKPPWPRIEYAALIRKYAGVDIESASLPALMKKAKELKIPTTRAMDKAHVADVIFKKFCLPRIWQPTFVIHHPAGSAALAKSLDEDSSKLGMFQLVVAGWELVKAYSELNDPVLQKEAFKGQEKLYRKGLKDAQRMDEDFIEALEYGMPPAAGFGMGMDRLTAILTDSHSLRESILFPAMKPKK